MKKSYKIKFSLSSRNYDFLQLFMMIIIGFAQLNLKLLILLVPIWIYLVFYSLKSIAYKNSIDRNNLFLYLFFLMWLIILIRPQIQNEEFNLEVLCLFTVILIGIVMSFAPKRKEIDIVNGVLYITSIISIITLISKKTGNLFFGLIREIPYYNRILGGFSGPNELANFLNIIIAYAFSKHFLEKKIKGIYILVIPIYINILLTYSRGGYIGILVTMFIIIIIILSKQENQKTLKIIISIILFLTLSYIVVFVMIPKMADIRSTVSGELDSSFFNSRNYIFEYTKELFLQKPIFGHGLGATAEYPTIYGNLTPHNTFYLFAIDGGIVGIFGILYMYFIILKLSLTKKLYPESVGLLMYY